MRLTKRIIDAISFRGGKGPDYRWDDGFPGFGMRVYPSGRKSFVVSYRIRGRKRILVLGRYGTLTLQEATRQARQIQVKALDGQDPLLERREVRKAEKKAKTVSEFCKVYLERHAKAHKKTWEADERRVRLYIEPALGALRLEEVDRESVARLYRDVGLNLGRPYEANRILSQLSLMFNLAIEWGYIPDGSRNPAKMRKRFRFKERVRDRPVTSAELPRLLSAIDDERDCFVRAALKLYLLTGLRKRELLDRKWNDLDLGRATLRLEDTKAGRPRHVPLSRSAVEVFSILPRMKGSPYIFPSPVAEGKPRNSLFKAWDRVRKRAGCEDLRIHDLRHSLATWLAEEGHAAQVIQEALGHQSIQTTMRYIHGAGNRPREALDSISGRILASTDSM